MNSKCNCSLTISMLGDGCRYCQPQLYIDQLEEEVRDLTEFIDKAFILHPNLDLDVEANNE